MTTAVADVIAQAREELLDDVAEPYLWTDPELLRHAAEAEREAARRSRLLIDSTTTAVARITLANGTAAYALDPRVIRINRAIVQGQTAPLALLMQRDLDRAVPGWESDTGTVPEALVLDYETAKVRAWPTPTAAGTVRLTVVRLPLATPNDVDDALELADEHCVHLKHWIAYRAFQKRDSETYNPEKAAEQLALFVAHFGRSQPAYDEQWAQHHYSGDAFNGRF